MQVKLPARGKQDGAWGGRPQDTEMGLENVKPTREMCCVSSEISKTRIF